MIAALMMGRAGSSGFPGKNTYPVLGRPLASYALLAARNSRFVNRLYITTDCPILADLGRQHGAELIERPAALATKAALGEDVFVHGYREILRRLASSGGELEFIVLLLANAATVTGELIDQGIQALRADLTLDSAVSVSAYNMWSPLRARRIGGDGCLHPFVPFETFGDPRTLSCDRDSQGDVYFADMGLSVVRPRCLEHLADGLLPQKWMGQRIHPVVSWGGCDVDFEWQVPMVEFWLRKHGFGEPSK